MKRPVTREATDARSHLHTDHQDCDPIFAAWLPPPDGPWRPRLAHVDPSRDAPPPHLALLSSQTTTSFSSCHHGIPSRLPLRPRADSLGRSLSLSPADLFSPVRLWSSSCLRPRFEYLAQSSSRDALYVHLFPHRPSPRSKYLIRPALPPSLLKSRSSVFPLPPVVRCRCVLRASVPPRPPTPRTHPTSRTSTAPPLSASPSMAPPTRSCLPTTQNTRIAGPGYGRPRYFPCMLLLCSVNSPARHRSQRVHPGARRRVLRRHDPHHLRGWGRLPDTAVQEHEGRVNGVRREYLIPRICASFPTIPLPRH